MDQKHGDTQPDMRMAVGEVLASVKHLLSQNADLRADIKALVADVKQEQDRMNERITHIEKFVWKGSGVVALAVVALPMAFHYLTI